jgi:hypothetical protein
MGREDHLKKRNHSYLYFSIFPKDNKTHLLGRKTECDLVINDPSFSREQTSFTYDPTKECWLIKDGGSQSLSRTGTWY